MSEIKTEKKKRSRLLTWFRRGFFGTKKEMSIFEEEQIQGPIRTIISNFRRKKPAMFGLIMFAIIFLTVVIGPIFSPLDLSYVENAHTNMPPGFSMLSVPGELKGNVKDIGIGNSFSVGLSNDGDLYVWGNTAITNSIDIADIPDEIRNANIVDLAVGNDHALAIDDAGRIYVWGNTRQGQDKIPEEVQNLPYDQIKKVIAGNQCSGVLTVDGYLYLWGNTRTQDVKLKEEYQGRIKDFEFTGFEYMVILDDDTVAYTGFKNDTAFISSYPKELEGKTVVDIATTNNAVAALTSAGEVYVWGTDTNILIPPEHESKFVEIYGGRHHLIAKMENGDYIGWGKDNFKQSSVPDKVNNSDIENIYVGGFYNYAVTSEGEIVTWGLKGYLLGTDEFGRDILNRLLNGGFTTMTVGAVAVIISTVLGVILGGLAGYFGGMVDMFIMRVSEVVGSIPSLPLLLILSSIIGQLLPPSQKMYLVMIVLGVVGWTGLCVLVRAEVLRGREQEYVTAAKAMGVKESKIVFKHIVPNVISTIIVNATLSFAGMMLTESGLAFLGFGIAPPQPTWGNMLTGANDSVVIQNYWWRWVFTSIVFGLCTISINLMGDGLRDAMDPRSAER